MMQNSRKSYLQLENSEISNVKLIKTEHSKAEEIILDLKAKAVIKAKTKLY